MEVMRADKSVGDVIRIGGGKTGGAWGKVTVSKKARRRKGFWVKEETGGS